MKNYLTVCAICCSLNIIHLICFKANQMNDTKILLVSNFNQ